MLLFITISSCNITEEKQLSRAAKTLHELGSLVYFESDPKLSDLVILDPKWLIDSTDMFLYLLKSASDGYGLHNEAHICKERNIGSHSTAPNLEETKGTSIISTDILINIF